MHNRCGVKYVLLALALVLTVAFLLFPLFVRRDQLRPHAESAAYAQRLVEDLIANRSRSTAICQLIGLRRYRATPRYEPEPCVSRKVRHFIGSPSSRVFGVTLEAEWMDNVRNSPIAGELILFDREGFLVPVFHGANVIDVFSGVFQYRGDDEWAVGLVYAASVDDNTSTQILNIVPVADPQRAVLRVILGPPAFERSGCDGYYWSWRARDTDGDGVPEVEIGPNLTAQGDIEPRAVFRWSGAQNAYVGPAPSANDPFMRFDGINEDCCGNAASKEFATRFAGVAPLEGFGVRRPVCESMTLETIAIH